MTETLVKPSVNDTETTALHHYAHPRRLDKTWCGAEREPVPYRWGARAGEKCAMCVYLLESYGIDGWLMGLA